MSILQTTDLKKYYGSGDTLVKALDGVNLSVEQGEFLSIVGTSGSGKSTLLHMLGGPSDKDYKVNKDGSISVKKVRQLSYQPDEGIFTWNGKKYDSVKSLVNAWNNTNLTDDDAEILKRKLYSQAGISL